MADRIQELKAELSEEQNIIDSSDSENESSAEVEFKNYPQQYSITSYGVDYDVRGLVHRLKSEAIMIPEFQRNYVWNLVDASRFIESLLLGLPVPGIFLAKDLDSNRLLVIDGQQRLKSLQFFFSGQFNPRPDEKSVRVFRLTGVNEKFNGKRYEDLDDETRLLLDDSVIHATVIKQDAPNDDNSSIYYIFERLNSGGRVLTPQEMRTAAFHGDLIALLSALNEDVAWRKIFGKPNSRLKDQELILRFLALLEGRNNYKKPLKMFLNQFCERHRRLDPKTVNTFADAFRNTISLVYEAIGEKAFRPENALNAAVFDSVMIGIAIRLSRGPIDSTALKATYDALFDIPDYKKYITQSTSDDNVLTGRIEIAINEFAKI